MLHTMRRTVITALVACLAGAATVGAIGSAATKNKSSTRQAPTAASGPPPTMKEETAKRDTDRDDFFADVAKNLGKDTADVKKAFEANRPARGKGGPGFGGPGGPGGPGGRHFERKLGPGGPGGAGAPGPPPMEMGAGYGA